MLMMVMVMVSSERIIQKSSSNRKWSDGSEMECM